MLLKYLKFLTQATNQHGVHSPFVYQLVTQCFYQKSNQKVIKGFTSAKLGLLKNKKTILITDFGSGSRTFSSNERKVNKIAKSAGIYKKHALLLNRIVRYLNCKNVLELGTSLGLATTAMVLENKQVQIDSLEGCSEILKIAESSFKTIQIEKQITTYAGEFGNTLPNVIKDKKYDLIFFDGNHQKEATLQYFETCLSTIHNDSVFIFDDIYWSEGMQEAWELIKQHPQVKVTIDVFKWGIVFFRKEQEKEHFKIRL